MAIRTSGTPVNNRKEKEITYRIEEECGTISTRANGDEVKLRYMSWNNGKPKYDLRIWKTDEDGNEKCSKGLTMTGEELVSLFEIIKKLMEE